MTKSLGYARAQIIFLTAMLASITAMRLEEEARLLQSEQVTTDAAGYDDELLVGEGAEEEGHAASHLASGSLLLKGSDKAVRNASTMQLPSDASTATGLGGLRDGKSKSDNESLGGVAAVKTHTEVPIPGSSLADLRAIGGEGGGRGGRGRGHSRGGGSTSPAAEPNATAFDVEQLLKALPLGGECGSIDQGWGVPAPYNYGLGCNTGRCQCPNALIHGCATSNRLFPIEGTIGKVVAELGYCRVQLAVYVIPVLAIALAAGYGVKLVTR
mmetsp:Transcript_34504/g.78768  ORF Transcript_34504/g.78768 Transcript_34504/m.78768 type:complete len:270 (+) Transcript_34504:95-904(+)